MRRLSRSLTAVFSLWFAVVLGDPGVLHSCAMHGGAGMHASHGMAQMDAGGVAMHHAMAHDDAPAPAPHDEAPATCTCLGHCSATTATAALPVVPSIELPAREVPHRAPSQAPVVGASAAPEHSLPFANGPPAA